MSSQSPAGSPPEPDAPEIILATPQAVLEEIALTTAELSLVRREVEESRPIDLAGFEARVGAICAALYGFDRKVATSMISPMTAMLDALDALGTSIDTAIGTPATRLRAASAYRPQAAQDAAAQEASEPDA
jgi:hypothetical protein